MQYLHH